MNPAIICGRPARGDSVGSAAERTRWDFDGRCGWRPRPWHSSPVCRRRHHSARKLAKASAPDTASYSIDATLDAAARTLTGREVITWRNPGGIPAYSIRLHLYWNAWRNTDSTWISQLKLAGLRRRTRWSGPPRTSAGSRSRSCGSMNPDGSPGPGSAARLPLHPAERSEPADRSLAAADLPERRRAGPDRSSCGSPGRRRCRGRSRAPAGSATTTSSPSGSRSSVCSKETAGTRASFSPTPSSSPTSDATTSASPCPAGWVVGATGREVSRTDDGRHDHPPLRAGRCARLRVDDQPGLRGGRAAVRAPDAAAGRRCGCCCSRSTAGRRIVISPRRRRRSSITASGSAPIPIPQITIVDPAWQSGAGGMEYPTLFTAGTRWLAPRQIERRPKPSPCTRPVTSSGTASSPTTK